MSELRMYAGTTGNCIAGDRWDYSEREQHRVESDFRAGVRLVIDEERGEIRGFVPAYRGTEEAFYAVLSVENEDVDTAAFVEAVRGLFERVDNWSIRTDTPEGQLLETLAASVEVDEESRVSIDAFSSGRQVRVGVPDLETAGRQLRTIRSRLTDDVHRQYALSHVRSPDHLSPDLLFHVSSSYDRTTTPTEH